MPACLPINVRFALPIYLIKTSPVPRPCRMYLAGYNSSPGIVTPQTSTDRRRRPWPQSLVDNTFVQLGDSMGIRLHSGPRKVDQLPPIICLWLWPIRFVLMTCYLAR